MVAPIRIAIAPGYPPVGRSIFVPTDAAAAFGPLQQTVAAALGVDGFGFDADIVSTQGWQTIGDAGSMVTAVLTVADDGARTRDLLRDNLAGALRTPAAEGPIWLPLMGTGAGGLSHRQSAAATLAAMLAAAPPGDLIILAPPVEADKGDVAAIADLAASVFPGAEVIVATDGERIEGAEYLTADDIALVQAQLEIAGYHPGAADGVLGRMTREALFQIERDPGESKESAIARVSPDSPAFVPALLAQALAYAQDASREAAPPLNTRVAAADLSDDELSAELDWFASRPVEEMTEWFWRAHGQRMTALEAERNARDLPVGDGAPEADHGDVYDAEARRMGLRDKTDEELEALRVQAAEGAGAKEGHEFIMQSAGALHVIEREIEKRAAPEKLSELRDQRMTYAQDIKRLSEDGEDVTSAAAAMIALDEGIERLEAQLAAPHAAVDGDGGGEGGGGAGPAGGSGASPSPPGPSDGERGEPAGPETAPFHSDRPARVDLLNRRAVADALGVIIDRVWTEELSRDDDQAFVIHLDGPWGSGKTSILNFLRDRLLSGEVAPQDGSDPHLARAPDPPWVVVDFNAWRAQHLGPAWWSMMEAVYRGAVDQLAARDARDAWRIRLAHWWWRVKSGFWPAIVGVALTAAAFLIVAWAGDGFGAWLAGAIPLVGFLVGGVAFRFAPNLLNTAKAQEFHRLSRDPVGPLAARYNHMVKETRRPVAVFVDDLDRCDAAYVVDLLQALQTLYRGARVIYVVAGDREWIRRSYEKAYADFAGEAALPGRSLGHMFLEKIFQLAVEVPPLGPDQKSVFWSRLLDVETEEIEDEASIGAEVAAALENAGTEAEIETVVRRFRTSPIRAAVAGAEGFRKMQSTQVRREQEHFLKRFAPLLEPNPRAMKRLLNAYGFRRGFEMQTQARSGREALARWTILETRWPKLADHLLRRDAAAIFAAEDDDPEMARLMRTAEVRAVAEGLSWSDLPHLASGRANAEAGPRNGDA